MRHPKFVERWRDNSVEKSTFREHDIRRMYVHDRHEMARKLAELEAERQRKMPPYWQTYLEIVAIAVAIVGIIGLFIWRMTVNA